MTAMREDRAPYPRNGRLWDETITGRQRGARHEFLLMLGVDPARVPDGARIEHDKTTDEYRLQVINPGGHLVWIRRVLRPLSARLPQLTGAIAPSLQALRDAYAHAMPIGRGLSADVVVIDDPITPGRAYDPALTAATLDWYRNYIRSQRA